MHGSYCTVLIQHGTVWGCMDMVLKNAATCVQGYYCAASSQRWLLHVHGPVDCWRCLCLHVDGVLWRLESIVWLQFAT